MTREALMPIMRHPEFRLPWALIAPHAAQAMKNHDQTLERLAERGGLWFSEALAVLEDRPWSHIEEPVARARLERLMAARGESL